MKREPREPDCQKVGSCFGGDDSTVQVIMLQGPGAGLEKPESCGGYVYLPESLVSTYLMKKIAFCLSMAKDSQSFLVLFVAISVMARMVDHKVKVKVRLDQNFSDLQQRPMPNASPSY